MRGTAAQAFLVQIGARFIVAFVSSSMSYSM